MQTLQENTTLQGGKYKILSVLGQGGFGITYLAEQVILERRVTIKEFFMKELCSRDGSTSHVTIGTEGSRETVTRFREKFLKEARNIAKLNHPNIVKIIDVFEENGTAYYVMEYAEGGSLADKVKREGYLSEPIATRYILQVAEALAYVHARKMNHLDVKPANIMLTGTDTAVLIDFGLSKQYDVGGQQTSTTPVGISEGYAPMEQYKQGGVGEFSPETDIYALGATFFKLLTGKTPLSASDVNEDGVPVDELKAKGVSDKAVKVICEAMKSRKKERPQSVEIFLEMVDEEKTSSPSPNDASLTKDETLVLQPLHEKKDLYNSGEDIKDANVSANKNYNENEKSKRSHIVSSKPSKKIVAVIGCLLLIAVIVVWGITYNNNDDLLVIPYQYDAAEDFSEGLACVSKDGKWGYIDKEGNVIIPFVYDFVWSFSEGLAPVERENKWGYIDKSGNEVIPCQYDYAIDFSDGLARVSKSGKCGFVDYQGKMVIPCKYSDDNLESFHDGLAKIRDGNKYGYIDKKGNEIIPCIYDMAYDFSEGLAAARKGNKWGYIDKAGNEIIPFEYDYAYDFFESLARVKKKEKTGWIDKKGNEVISCQYEITRGFSEGLAMVVKSDKYGFIDNRGSVVIPFNERFYPESSIPDLCVFHEDLALVTDGDKYGYIDKEGQNVIPCHYEFASHFSEGLAVVVKDDKWGYIKKP